MPKFSAIYKQTVPTRRIVSGENTYEKGMMWSNQALPPGYTHTLLNLEVDNLTGVLNVPGGFHNTDVAAGCTFIDNATFGLNVSGQVVVLQGRNEYCNRAFEGITNIISVQRLAIKNNQTLAERLRQQGFTADDVICYKILTYNPINHRLMSVTLIKAPRDRYFTLGEDLFLRRLNVNPISCGFSEVWDNGSNGIYVSNCLNYHPNGAEDSFIPRVHRNKLDETFNQVLHNPLHMQTIAHCEGFGNKTFMFTKKKQIDLAGPIVNLTPAFFIDVYKFNILFWFIDTLHMNYIGTYSQGSTRGYVYYSEDISTEAEFKEEVGTWGHQVGDIIKYSTTDPENTLESAYIRVNEVRNVWLYDDIYSTTLLYEATGVITNYTILSHGIFKGEYVDDTGTVSSTGSGSFRTRSPAVNIEYFQIVDPNLYTNYQYDTYLGNMHTGLTSTSSAAINNEPVPIDAYRFGIALTSLGIRSSLSDASNTDLTLEPADATDLWDKTVANKVEALGKVDGNAVIGIDLNNGLIKPAIQGLAEGSYLEVVRLPVLARSSKTNDTPLTIIFKSTNSIVKINNWDNSKTWFHPADLLLDTVNNFKRIGQGIRLTAYCKVLVPLTRYLRTLSEDPFDSEYYTSNPTSVFVLDYVWNGKEWEFSFIDTRYPPTNGLPYLTENWDQNGYDSLGNRIARHYIWTNNLSYTDIVTEDNITNMPKHIVDNLQGSKAVADRATGTIIGTVSNTLDIKLNETLEDKFGENTIQNKSKIFDTSYGHFEITPKLLTPAEAAKWGYNMLSSTPYTFECVDTPGLEPQLTGVLLMRNGQPLLKPVINTPGTLYIYFRAAFDTFATPPTEGGGYQLKVEYKNIFDEWRSLKEFSTTETHTLLNAGRFIEIPFSSPDETVLIRATIINRNETVNVALTDGTTEDHYLVSSQLITTLSFSKDPNQSNISPKIYDLGSALGMTYWKGRLVAWGVLNAENILFLSEPNEPEYFAYPNGIDIFEENIVHVISYSDSLVVFTSTKLWRLDMSVDGLTWSKTLLQQNLRIIDKDIPYITVLKNMLFFKSDKQFYMLVPQRSGTVGELTLAPISKSIQDFLDKPFDNLRSIFKNILPISEDGLYAINNYLVKYGVHAEQTRIFVDWWFDLTDWENKANHIKDLQVVHDDLLSPHKEYWLVQLVYDVQTYSWTIRTHISPAIGLFVTDAANTNTDFVSLVHCGKPTYEGASIFTDAEATWGVSIAQRRTTNDSLFTELSLTEPENSLSNKSETLIPSYSRIQVLDTGYMEVASPALKKHFREIQLTLEPKESDVGFKPIMEVVIDGNEVLTQTVPQVTEESNGDGTKTFKIIEQINYQDLTSTEASSKFIVNAKLNSTFVLDSSTLEGVKSIKVRKAINGKGYLAKLKFTNITETNYSIINHAFVYKSKNAR